MNHTWQSHKYSLGLYAFIALLLPACSSTSGQATQPVTIQSSGIFASQSLWTYDSLERIIGTPILYNGLVYVRSADAVIILDKNTGREISVVANIPGRYEDTHPPVVYEGHLFVPDADGALVTYDLESLKLKWKGCSEKTGCAPFTSVNAPIVSMTYSGNTLVASRYDNALTAYDIETGRILWEDWVDHRLLLDIHSKDNILYSGGYTSIVAYDIRSGKQIWSYPLALHGRFVIDGDMLLMVTGSGPTTKITAFDTVKQSIVWESPISTRQATIDTYLTLHKDTLIVASDSVTAIDVKNGKKLWETDQLDDLEQPVMSGDTLLVRDFESQLFAFDVYNGQQIGTLSLQNKAPRIGGAELNPAVDGNTAIIQIGSNHLVALKLAKP